MPLTFVSKYLIISQIDGYLRVNSFELLIVVKISTFMNTVFPNKNNGIHTKTFHKIPELEWLFYHYQNLSLAG